jgi:hypothetical protein
VISGAAGFRDLLVELNELDKSYNCMTLYSKKTVTVTDCAQAPLIRSRTKYRLNDWLNRKNRTVGFDTPTKTCAGAHRRAGSQAGYVYASGYRAVMACPTLSGH